MKKIKNSRFGKWWEKPVGFLLGILMVISPSPLSLAVDPLPVSSGPSLQPTVPVDANGVYVLTSGDTLILKASDFINEKRAEKQNRNGALDGAEISISANGKGNRRVDIALDRSYAEGLSASVVINGGAGEPNGKTIEGLRPIVCSKAGNRCVFSIEGVEVSPEFDLRIIFKQGESVVESKTKNMKFTIKPRPAPPAHPASASGSAPGINPVIHAQNVPGGPLSRATETPPQTPNSSSNLLRQETRPGTVELGSYRIWSEGSRVVLEDTRDPSRRQSFHVEGAVQGGRGSIVTPAVVPPSSSSTNGNHSLQAPPMDPATAVALPRDRVLERGDNGFLAQPRSPFHPPEPDRTQPGRGQEGMSGGGLSRQIELIAPLTVVSTSFVSPFGNVLVRLHQTVEMREVATGSVVYESTTDWDLLLYTATLRDPEANYNSAVVHQTVCQGHPVFGWSCATRVDHPSSRDPDPNKSPVIQVSPFPITERFSLIQTPRAPEPWEQNGRLGQVIHEPRLFDQKTGRSYSIPMSSPTGTFAIEVTGANTLRIKHATHYLDPSKKTYVQEFQVTRTEVTRGIESRVYPPTVSVDYRLDLVREYHSAEPLPQRNSTAVAVFSPACGRLSKGGILDLIRTGGRQEYYCLS